MNQCLFCHINIEDDDSVKYTQLEYPQWLYFCSKECVYNYLKEMKKNV